MSMARAKIWTSTIFNINVAASGQAGGQAVNIGGALVAQLGLVFLAGYTVGPIFIEMLLLSDGDNSASDIATVSVGVGIFDEGMDGPDFPDMAVGNGDYMFRKDVVFEMPGAISSLVNPPQIAHQSLKTRSMRKLDRAGDQAMLVVQQNNANDMIYHFAVSSMWRMP